MSGETAMLWRSTEFPPRGGLVRLAHWAKRAYTSPSAYRKLTASRLPVSNCWNRAASPKRVTAATACRASAGSTTSSAPSRAPSRPFQQLRSEEHTSELQSRLHLVCRLLLEKKK